MKRSVLSALLLALLVVNVSALRRRHFLREDVVSSTETPSTPKSPSTQKLPTTIVSSTKTTTVAAVTTTTTASKDSNCTAASVCYADKDCNGGHCLGLFVGKCNCNACFNFLTCESDQACGGLKGACNGTTSRCSCMEGFQANGFATFLDALRGLCNTKECHGDDRDQCFGLPCNAGRCVC